MDINDPFIQSMQKLRLDLRKQADEWLARAVRDALHRQTLMQVIDHDEYEEKHRPSPDQQASERRRQLAGGVHEAYAQLSAAAALHKQAFDRLQKAEAVDQKARTKLEALEREIMVQKSEVRGSEVHLQELVDAFHLIQQELRVNSLSDKTPQGARSASQEARQRANSIAKAAKKAELDRTQGLIDQAQRALSDHQRELERLENTHARLDEMYSTRIHPTLERVLEQEREDLSRLDAERERARALWNVLPPAVTLLLHSPPAPAAAGAAKR